MESILSFDRYNVIESIYRHNPFNELETEDVSPKFDLKIKYQSQERESAALFFSLELGDSNLVESSFYLKATVLGVFSLESEEELSKEFINHMYRKNAFAILYPYMRSLVSDLSSKGSESAVILPPINIGAMAENESLITEEYSDNNK